MLDYSVQEKRSSMYFIIDSETTFSQRSQSFLNLSVTKIFKN